MSPFELSAVRAAVEIETETRDAAFVSVPSRVEGLTLPPLTLRHYLTLTLAGNAFVCERAPVAADAAQFLYVLSESKRTPAAFAKEIAGLSFLRVCEGIASHLKEAFFDAPPKDTGGASRSYYSIAASLSDLFAKEYGWPVSETLNAPLAVLFQMLRAIQRRTTPDAPLFNPLSDKALAEATPKEAAHV